MLVFFYEGCCSAYFHGVQFNLSNCCFFGEKQLTCTLSYSPNEAFPDSKQLSMFPLLGMLIDQDIHEHTEHILLHSQVESLYFVGHTVVVKVGDR